MSLTARKATIAVLFAWLVAWIAVCDMTCDELDDNCWDTAT